MIFELCPNGTLFDYVSKTGHLSEPVSRYAGTVAGLGESVLTAISGVVVEVGAVERVIARTVAEITCWHTGTVAGSHLVW